ncbi:DUF397 domain-containing protein [Streptomyces sp. NPDC058045]|uniref:DUF397 domain-containing protein n=1 Tax=Streptomyces sp. NPDC058045 TaxID=3346311 RepID=UPI0036EB6D81
MTGTRLAWFTSTYSGTQGDNCVQVALEWFKSSYSGTEGDNCIEVATNSPTSVHLRDSKDPAKGELALGPTTWSAFIGFAADQA